MKSMKNKEIYFLIIGILVSFLFDDTVSEFILTFKIPFLIKIMEWFSHEVTVFGILLIISSLFLYEERKNNYIPLLFLSFFLAFFSSFFLKFLILRQRPFGLDYMIINFFDFVLKIPNYGFPSSHAAMAFSVVPILDKEFKKLKLFWFLFAIMVCISRIYLNQHYLSDVVAGSFLGYLSGYYTLKLGEKHNVKHL
ncbi:MAG: phosphatase PAP2 family protein [Candidatus Woesearchaeota archaeon]